MGKNTHYSVARIISIPYMAQAMMAITLLKPDSARARPSTLINSDPEYKKIFSLDIPIDVYLKVIQLMKAVEFYLKPDNCGITLERKVITNIKYYLGMKVAILLLGTTANITEKLALIPTVELSTELLDLALKEVLEKYESLGASDQVAKGSTFVAELLKDPHTEVSEI